MNTDVFRLQTGRPLPSGQAIRNLTGSLSRVGKILGTWHRRAAQRHQLAMLDEHMLKDIGLDRRTAEAEIAKPFWRA